MLVLLLIGYWRLTKMYACSTKLLIITIHKKKKKICEQQWCISSIRNGNYIVFTAKGKVMRLLDCYQVGKCKYLSAYFTQNFPWKACSNIFLWFLKGHAQVYWWFGFFNHTTVDIQLASDIFNCPVIFPMTPTVKESSAKLSVVCFKWFKIWFCLKL